MPYASSSPLALISLITFGQDSELRSSSLHNLIHLPVIFSVLGRNSILLSYLISSILSLCYSLRARVSFMSIQESQWHNINLLKAKLV
jgi:hypothetical protein